jgi:K+:H+ antiporter subunit KhtU
LLLLGIEYSAEELTASLRRSAGAGLVDLALNFTPGLAAGLLLGWPPLAAVVLGGVTYVSSSGIAAKLLGDLGRLGNRETPIVLSILVVEDLAMAAYLPILAGLLAAGSVLAKVVPVVVALVTVAVVLAVTLRWGPGPPGPARHRLRADARGARPPAHPCRRPAGRHLGPTGPPTPGAPDQPAHRGRPPRR